MTTTITTIMETIMETIMTGTIGTGTTVAIGTMA